MDTKEKTLISKSFDAPDETQDFPNSKVEILRLGGRELTRLTAYPGWRWSKDIKPLTGTELCEVEHVGYQLSGRMHVILRDGTEYDLEPGMFQVVPPGHDAYVVGDEPFVVIPLSDQLWQIKE